MGQVRRTFWTILALGASAAVVGVLSAQAPALSRRVLQQADLSAPGREAVMAAIDVPAGVSAGRHTHPGEEIGYMLEGTLELKVDGQPVRTLKAGDVFLIPANTVHDATNTSAATAKIVSTYVVEKGKPLATPAR